MFKMGDTVHVNETGAWYDKAPGVIIQINLDETKPFKYLLRMADHPDPDDGETDFWYDVEDFVEAEPKHDGPLVITALSWSATPPTARVWAISPEGLSELENDWVRWKSVHGRGKTEQAVQFKATADLMLGRIRREMKRRKKVSDAARG